MKIAIHQPNYLPWPGYFYKMANCDLFIFLDNVQYENNGFTNRTRIKTAQGASWLTLPIKRNFPKLVKEAELEDSKENLKKHLRSIEVNYKKAKNFDDLFPDLERIMSKDWKYLSDLNIELIKMLKDKLEIKTELRTAPDVPGKKNELIINICKEFKADTYLSGLGAKEYQDEREFERSGIKLEYSDFKPIVYPQLWGEFEDNLSAIDLIFNHAFRFNNNSN